MDQEDHVMLYVGIDQHRKQLTVCSGRIGQRARSQHKRTAWQKVRGRSSMKPVRASPVRTAVIWPAVEICGFNQWLLKLLLRTRLRRNDRRPAGGPVDTQDRPPRRQRLERDPVDQPRPGGRRGCRSGPAADPGSLHADEQADRAPDQPAARRRPGTDAIH